jgi:glycosyltransferase involved in cell wall biosynthesis
VVEDGVTGFLCRPRDAIDLADKMKKMLSLSVETRREMGRAGRRKMIAQYDEHIVINKYLDILNKLKLEKKNV